MSVNKEQVLRAVQRLTEVGSEGVSSSEVVRASGGSSATVRRHLDALHAAGELQRVGKARATRYRLSMPMTAPLLASEPDHHASWSAAALRLRRRLDTPVAARDPVTYQRDFVDRYMPNTTWLMPQAQANELYRLGRMQDQQPAGTYAPQGPGTAAD